MTVYALHVFDYLSTKHLDIDVRKLTCRHRSLLCWVKVHIVGALHTIDDHTIKQKMHALWIYNPDNFYNQTRIRTHTAVAIDWLSAYIPEGNSPLQ